MVNFTVKGRIQAPRNQVWRVLSDYGNIAAWNTGIAKSHILGKKTQGIGAVRQCHAASGMIIEERVTDWHEGEGFRLAFDKIPAPIQDAAVTFKLSGSDPALLAIDYEYRGKGLGVLVAPLMKPLFRKAMTNLLADLKGHCEAAVAASKVAPTRVGRRLQHDEPGHEVTLG